MTHITVSLRLIIHMFRDETDVEIDIFIDAIKMSVFTILPDFVGINDFWLLVVLGIPKIIVENLGHVVDMIDPIKIGIDHRLIAIGHNCRRKA